MGQVGPIPAEALPKRRPAFIVFGTAARSAETTARFYYVRDGPLRQNDGPLLLCPGRPALPKRRPALIMMSGMARCAETLCRNDGSPALLAGTAQPAEAAE